MNIFRIRNMIFLFLLLVVTISSGLLFSVEPFRSSSSNNRGQGIGDSFAAPLDLSLNTDNSRLFVIPTNF
jgi:hypothetical protein